MCVYLGQTTLLAPVPELGRMDHLHDVSGVPAAAKQVRHHLQRAIDVTKEGLVSSTEIVQSLFAVRREQEAIARTLTVTGKSHFALLAIAGKAIPFGISKRDL